MLTRKPSPGSTEPQWLSELSEVVDSLPDLIATFDRDGELLFINRAGVEWLGYSEAQLTDLLLSDLYRDADVERIIPDALSHALEYGRWHGRSMLTRADGTSLEVDQQWIAHRFRPDKARAFTLVAEISPVGLESDESRNRRELIVVMTLGLVHALNNIFGPITAYVDLISRTEASSQYLEPLARVAERGHELARRLSEIARDRTPLRAPVDLLAITREVVSWARVVRPDLDITLLRDTSANTTIMGDRVALYQVVMNVVQNACEALSDRAGTIRIRLASVPSGVLRLSVEDDGRGIRDSLLTKAFEPFVTSKPEGSGLGLSITREIVREHDGRIEIDRAEPCGTIVSIDLPSHADDEDP